jgi:hypothetical protein
MFSFSASRDRKNTMDLNLRLSNNNQNLLQTAIVHYFFLKASASEFKKACSSKLFKPNLTTTNCMEGTM